MQAELARGRVPAGFHALCARIGEKLGAALAGSDAVIAHNVFTLHKNLALTSALHMFLQGPAAPPVAVAWHHDLAWTSGQYRPELSAGQPWDLLRTPWPGVRHVTVSAARRAELAKLYGIGEEAITVVPAGVDPARFFKWEPLTVELVARYNLAAAGTIFLLPARLTRRKNIEQALRILAAYREQTGEDARLIVTGPPGPHNATNTTYLDALLAQRRQLGLAAAAHFLYETAPAIPDEVMADLYQLSDALLFPSSQEGFGIPVLEAGLTRLPVFCSDIPPLRETGDGAAHFFDPQADPAITAAAIVTHLEADRAHLLRRRVRLGYTWAGIVEEQVLPLLRSPRLLSSKE